MLTNVWVSAGTFLLAAALIFSCANSDNPSGGSGSATVDTLVVEVIETLPHDTSAYTQGLEISQGDLWESTGLYGASTLRRLDPQDGSILEFYVLPDTLFGEGLTVEGGVIYQLTWRSGLVLEWDVSNPMLQVSDTIETEGWGITSIDGSTVVTSNGTATLSYRDIDSFDTLSTIEVTMDGVGLSQLNELEYAGDHIYANRYYSDYIYRIDPQTGRVTAIIDATDLRLRLNTFAPGVLNGIAWDPDRQAFLVTGKRWPLIFVVNFQQT